MASSEPDIRNDMRPRLAVGHSPADDERPWHPGDPLVPATWLEYAAADGSVCCTRRRPGGLRADAARRRRRRAQRAGLPADDHAPRRLRRRHRLRLRARRPPRRRLDRSQRRDGRLPRADVDRPDSRPGSGRLLERPPRPAPAGGARAGRRRAGPGRAGRHRPPGDLRRRPARRVARAARHLPVAQPLDDLPRGRHPRRQAAGRPGRRGAGADARRGWLLPGRRRGVEPRAAALRHRGGRRRHAGAAQHLALRPHVAAR